MKYSFFILLFFVYFSSANAQTIQSKNHASTGCIKPDGTIQDTLKSMEPFKTKTTAQLVISNLMEPIKIKIIKHWNISKMMEQCKTTFITMFLLRKLFLRYFEVH
jgi:hypothetical protein